MRILLVFLAIVLGMGCSNRPVPKTWVHYKNGKCETGRGEIGIVFPNYECPNNPRVTQRGPDCIYALEQYRDLGQCVEENKAMAPSIVVRCIDELGRYSPSPWTEKAVKVSELECQP